MGAVWVVRSGFCYTEILNPAIAIQQSDLSYKEVRIYSYASGKLRVKTTWSR